MLCIKCKIRLVNKPFEGYNVPLCWICYLKSIKHYKAAMREVKNGWFDWHTNLLELKLGWSFWEKVLFQGLFISVLKMKSLNKTPKTNATVKDFYSDWRIKTADEYCA